MTFPRGSTEILQRLYIFRDSTKIPKDSQKTLQRLDGGPTEIWQRLSRDGSTEILQRFSRDESTDDSLETLQRLFREFPETLQKRLSRDSTSSETLKRLHRDSRDSAEILQRRCRDLTEVLQRSHSNSTEALQRFSRDDSPEVILERWLYIDSKRDSAETSERERERGWQRLW